MGKDTLSTRYEGGSGPPVGLRWKLLSCSGVLLGVPGVTRPMMTERSERDTFLVAPLLEYQGMPERL